MIRTHYTGLLTRIGPAVGALMLLSAPQLAGAQGQAAHIRPARLDYKITTLKNGLKVITLEDHRAPVVTLEVWYHVGSKDEAEGKAGFAHLFEHLMFKGSAHVPPEGHARYIEQLGGDYNADTSFDRTRFFETVPANALDRILWLEADRMSSLRVDEKNLDSERNVVKEEHRLRVENSPYGSLFENVQGLLFPKRHPYAHTTIGIMADLDSAKLTDVLAFHDEYYKPDNATLVLVGDFRTAEAVSKINRYFGWIPHSTHAFTRYPVLASDQTEERRAVFHDPLAPLPLIGIAFRTPAASDPDTPVFDVITQILSAGQSSRLFRSLVRDKQLAVEASGNQVSLKLAGIYFFYALANGGKSPADVEAALLQQVNLLINEPVTDAELAKAKNQTLTEKVFGSVSTEEKATELAEADLLYDTPEEVNREFDSIAAVTADDVRRVAAKYFQPAERNFFQVLPPQRPTAPQNGEGK